MRTLVLLCGLLCDATIWADIPRRLEDVAEVHIISFGGLDSIGAMAERVLDLAPQSFALAGHSMGGRVALEAWRRAAHRVTGLGLLNTDAHPTEGAEYENRAALVRLARTQGMDALAAAWLPPLMRAAPARVAEIMPPLAAMVGRSTPDSFAGQIQALLRRPDARPVLPTVHVPTLVLGGSNDTWASLSRQSAMQRNVTQARWVEVVGAGHMSPIERPDAVARALRGWLKELP